MSTDYHFGKIITWYYDSALYSHQTTVFADGTTHCVVYNTDMKWISSIVVDVYGRSYERVEYIDNKGEITIGYPSQVIDGNGNEYDTTVIV